MDFKPVGLEKLDQLAEEVLDREVHGAQLQDTGAGHHCRPFRAPGALMPLV
jgi:hypothetical protein